MTKSPSAAVASRRLMSEAGCQKVGQRDGAEIVTDQRAGPGGGHLQGRNAGMRGDGHPPRRVRQGTFACRLQQFEDKARHGINLRIAGRDQRHLLALTGQGQGVAHPHLLVAEREAMQGLAGVEIGDEIEIKTVADPVRRGGQSAICGCRALGRLTRSDTDDVERSARPAETGDIDRRRPPARRRRWRGPSGAWEPKACPP